MTSIKANGSVTGAIPRTDPDFLAPRRCLREPIAAIFHAAHLLDRAVGAHLAKKHALAGVLIREADMPEVGMWVDSLWGAAKNHPEQAYYHRVRRVQDAPPHLAKDDRDPTRMPNAEGKAALIERWGYTCAFCGIPVIREEVRDRMHKAYPDDLRWGKPNATQHAAFQCLWLQYDHVLPHARGGSNGPNNIVITCAGCNYGSRDGTLEEQGLIDPRERSPIKTSWDGLERFR